jgi:ribosomal protein S18 acetylase RimI-like enzyme
MRSLYQTVWLDAITAPTIAVPILTTAVLVTALVTKRSGASAGIAAAVTTLAISLAACWWQISDWLGSYIQFCLDKDDLCSSEKLQTVYGGNGTFLVALDSNQDLVGMVGGEEKSGVGIFELRRMSVDSRYRGKGVGRALLSRLQEELPAKQIFLTTTSTQHAARRLYESVGFQCGKGGKEFPFGSWFTQQAVSLFRYEKNY